MGETPDDEQKGIVFHKHSALVAMACDLTLTQRKAFNGFLAVAAVQLGEDPTRDRFNIPFSDLAEFGIKSKETKRLIAELEKMQDLKAKWNFLNKDKTVKYESTVLLADFTIDEGIKELIVGFSPLVRERILKPRMYAPLQMNIIRAFTRKHTVVLYETCKDYRLLNRFELTISKLRDLLAIGEKEYARQSAFEEKVIFPAIEEMNLKSDLNVEYRYSENVIIFQISEKEITGESISVTEQIELIALLPEELRTNKKLITSIRKYYSAKGPVYVSSNIKFALKKAKKNPSKLIEMALDDDYAHDERAKAYIASKKIDGKKIFPLDVNNPMSELELAINEQNKYMKYFNGLTAEEQSHILDLIAKAGLKYVGPKKGVFA